MKQYSLINRTRKLVMYQTHFYPLLPKKGFYLSDKDELRVFGELKGNTLLVYLYLVRNPKAVGAREVQRALNFSSPALATYHLEKLETLGLIRKEQEGYVLTKEVKIGALSQVVKFGSLILPRYIFYLTLFSVLLVCYLAFAGFTNSFELNIHSGFAVLLGLTIISVMFYECVRIWKQRPV
jgi:predicted DNA-binding transcriptional regulator